MVMKKHQLLALLRDITERIEADDSFDGWLNWWAQDEPGVFRVTSRYRIGNSEGQGGWRMVE